MDVAESQKWLAIILVASWASQIPYLYLSIPVGGSELAASFWVKDILLVGFGVFAAAMLSVYVKVGRVLSIIACLIYLARFFRTLYFIVTGFSSSAEFFDLLAIWIDLSWNLWVWLHLKVLLPVLYLVAVFLLAFKGKIMSAPKQPQDV